jgi:hypothetical protein
MLKNSGLARILRVEHPCAKSCSRILSRPGSLVLKTDSRQHVKLLTYSCCSIQHTTTSFASLLTGCIHHASCYTACSRHFCIAVVHFASHWSVSIRILPAGRIDYLSQCASQSVQMFSRASSVLKVFSNKVYWRLFDFGFLYRRLYLL